MAVGGSEGDVVTLRVVYYGPPGAGKTTNLERISTLIHGNEAGRITPRRVGDNRIASLEIPIGSLGVGVGSQVVVRLETLQGEVSNAGRAWSDALSHADGIVFVADSSAHARIANVRALAGITERLGGRGRTVAAIPVVMQWNKRDGDDARPIAELESELNHRCFPAIESSSRRGTGVAETLIEILKSTINAARQRARSGAFPEAELERTLTATMERLAQSALDSTSERFGMTIERRSAAWPEVREGARLQKDDDGTWPREVVYSAEAIDLEPTASPMLAALERASSALNGRSSGELSPGLMAGLLDGCDRARGSLLLFRSGTERLEESEVVPSGSDPLNAPHGASGGTTAATLCLGREPVLLDNPLPGTDRLLAVWVVPLMFGSLSFGGLLVYVAKGEHPPTADEKAYWQTAAGLTSVYLALRSAGTRPTVARRTGMAPALDELDPLDS